MRTISICRLAVYYEPRQTRVKLQSKLHKFRRFIQI